MSRSTWEKLPASFSYFIYRTITFDGQLFQVVRLYEKTKLSELQLRTNLPTTTRKQDLQTLTFTSFRLIPFRSPLLWEYRLVYLPQVTKMVQFTWFCLRLATDDWILIQPGCPIRRSPDQSLFAAPRSISSLTTSFVTFPCQVIHHKPFVS